MKKAHIAIVVVLLTALAFTAPTSARAPMIPVNCGDVLNIPGGQYMLTSDLVCGVGPALMIVAPDVHLNLAGRTLSGPWAPPPAGQPFSAGVLVLAAGAHIEGGSITGFFFGIYLFLASHTHVSGIVAFSNRNGIALFDSHDNKIDGNTFTGSLNNGVYLQSADRNRIHGNSVTFNGRGLLIGYINLFPPPTGLFVARGGDDNVITGNELSSNNLGGFFDDGRAGGLMIWGVSHRNTVRGNRAEGNPIGISVSQGENNLIQANRVTGNTIAGIEAGFAGPVPASLAGTVIQANTAVANTSPGPFPVPAPPAPADLIDWLLYDNGASPVLWRSNNFRTDSEGNGPRAGFIR